MLVFIRLYRFFQNFKTSIKSTFKTLTFWHVSANSRRGWCTRTPTCSTGLVYSDSDLLHGVGVLGLWPAPRSWCTRTPTCSTFLNMIKDKRSTIIVKSLNKVNTIWKVYEFRNSAIYHNHMVPLNIAIKISKSPFLLCFISENENSVKGISAKEQKRN